MSVVYNRTVVVNNASRWDAVNDELEKIQTALTDALSRSGAAPNAMADTLDMGDNDILNVGTISVDDLLIDGAQVPSLDDLAEAYAGYLADLNDVVDDADDQFNVYLGQAAQAVTDAETAETNAQGHESAASDYADEAENWANYPEDQLVPEGNQVDEYSAFHWAQKAAEEAAGVNLPSVAGGDSGKFLQVNSGETGYELVDFYETNTADFSADGAGEFSAGTCYLTRIGNQVTLHFEDIALTSPSTSATTLAGFVPSSYAPNSSFGVDAVLQSNANGTENVGVLANGQIQFTAIDWAGVSKNVEVGDCSVTYIIS